MSEHLNDWINLNILENICFGTGVEVNISHFSTVLQKHRNTIRKEVDALFENRIIDRPIYPFKYLFTEYPLMVIARAELPRNDKIDKFLKSDEHIFGAFFIRDEEFNTLMIEYHKDLSSYNKWKKNLVIDKILPPRETRFPAQSQFFSSADFVKYQPYSPIYKLEKALKEGKKLLINEYEVSPLAFEIMKRLVVGEGIRTNEHLLANKLDIHRNTIRRRIEILTQNEIIGNPCCRFPRFFVPPGYILVYSLIEIKRHMDEILKEIRMDPSVPFAVEALIGRYNLMLLSVFSTMEESYDWEERYDNKFKKSIGAVKNLYLLPKKTANIDQQDVSMGIIRKRKESLRGKELLNMA